MPRLITRAIGPSQHPPQHRVGQMPVQTHQLSRIIKVQTQIRFASITTTGSPGTCLNTLMARLCQMSGHRSSHIIQSSYRPVASASATGSHQAPRVFVYLQGAERVSMRLECRPWWQVSHKREPTSFGHFANNSALNDHFVEGRSSRSHSRSSRSRSSSSSSTQASSVQVHGLWSRCRDHVARFFHHPAKVACAAKANKDGVVEQN